MLDERVRKVLQALEGAGYEAYVVGGAVRDMVMNRQLHDYDVTTSARPEEIRIVAEKMGWHTVEIHGDRFGVVVLVVEGLSIETATFRGERYGEDSHRPDAVWYADTLREDVLRRDFTCNALAMDARGSVYDYVGGQKDIAKKRLVTVGDGATRFSEDSLRMFRFCRFIGQLGFTPETKSLKAIPTCLHRVGGLSLERVMQELDKLMVSKWCGAGLNVLVRTGLGDCHCRRKSNGTYVDIPILPELTHLVTTPQSLPFHAYDAWVHTLVAVDHTPQDLTIRYAMLLHDVAKGLPGIRGFHKDHLTDYGHDVKGADMARDILTRLGKSPSFVTRVAWLVRNHMKFHYFANTGEGDVWKWLRKEALSHEFKSSASLSQAFLEAGAVAVGDIWGCGRGEVHTEGTEEFARFMAELALEMPVGKKDLHYDRRIPDICGPLTGACLDNLLMRVQNRQLENQSDVLLEAARHWFQRNHRAEDRP